MSYKNSAVNCIADERPVVPFDKNVLITFQLKHPSSNAWTRSTINIRGAVSESMMINEVLRRYPDREVRILSAFCEKNIDMTVRYQLSRDGKSWTYGTLTLRNALTESMARNQIELKFPGSEARILSMVLVP